MIKSILRTALMLTLAIIAFSTACMSPESLTAQIITGTIGIAALAAITILYPRWAKTDRTISAYHRWATKAAKER